MRTKDADSVCDLPLTHHVQHEADESMVGCERQKHLVHQQDMLEVVNDTLSVEEVHGRRQEIPIERFCKAQVLLSARNIRNCDDFLKGDDLNRRHNRYQIYMTGEHGTKEASNHDERPDRTSNKCLSLLFIFRNGWSIRFLEALVFLHPSNLSSWSTYLFRNRFRFGRIPIFSWTPRI